MLYGGCSSVVERLLVEQDVAGSNPVSHPTHFISPHHDQLRSYVETNIVEAGPFERVVTVQIENTALESAKDEAAKRLSKDMKVKGFRPGKVPRKVVEATVGSDKLRSEAIEVALPGIVADARPRSSLRRAARERRNAGGRRRGHR